MKTSPLAMRDHPAILLQSKMQDVSKRGVYTSILLIVCSLLASFLSIWGSPRIFSSVRNGLPAWLLLMIPLFLTLHIHLSKRLRL